VVYLASNNREVREMKQSTIDAIWILFIVGGALTVFALRAKPWKEWGAVWRNWLAKEDDELIDADAFDLGFRTIMVMGVTLWLWGYLPTLPQDLWEKFVLLFPYVGPVLSVYGIFRFARASWLQRNESQEEEIE